MPESVTTALEGLTEVEGWQAVWAERRAAAPTEDDFWEAERRKGKVFDLTEDEGRLLATVIFPTVVPDCEQRYRYGMPAAMPDYKIAIDLSDNVLRVTATMEDPVVSKLCGVIPDFPATFSVRFDLTHPVKGFSERYWNKMLVVQLLAVESAEQALGAHRVAELVKAAPVPAENPNIEWRAHYITSECVGCSICDIKCPTHAISGKKKDIYVIEPELCINCGVCGIYCPYDAIVDQHGDLVKRIKAKDIPKAVVIPELCSGCEYCIDTCPFDCISLVPAPNAEGEPGHMSSKVAFVDDKTCVSCGICETFCIKEAIIVDRKFQWNESIGFSYQEGRLVPTPDLPTPSTS